MRIAYDCERERDRRIRGNSCRSNEVAAAMIAKVGCGGVPLLTDGIPATVLRE